MDLWDGRPDELSFYGLTSLFTYEPHFKKKKKALTCKNVFHTSINTQDFTFMNIATLRFLDPLTVGIVVSFQSSEPLPEVESP